PNTGLLLQQTPQQPATVPPSDLDLRMLHFRKQPVSDTHAFMVKRIRIVGKELTLGNLEDLANIISAAYLRAGYPLVRVYVPAQTLSGGVVKLSVVEARLEKIVLQNRNAVKDGPLQATLAPLQPGQPVS